MTLLLHDDCYQSRYECAYSRAYKYTHILFDQQIHGCHAKHYLQKNVGKRNKVMMGLFEKYEL